MEETINAGIVTIYMNNINPETVRLQRQVVQKFNPKKYPHYSINVNMSHGHALDLSWQLNGIDHPTFKDQKDKIPKKFDHDVLLFLDVDAVPLCEEALEYYIDFAARGWLIGNAQRSNHIQNNQHMFAAPSVYAMSSDIFVSILRPSAIPTSRGDVGEEITYAAEKSGIAPIKMIMPLKWELMPSEGHSWALKDGMPVYGCQTTFGEQDKPLFFHHFQIFHKNNQELFWRKCEALLQ
ncbi:MAG: hypothetical protein ACRDFB_10585 [Rhabdochlamydiaceae bacterium]